MRIFGLILAGGEGRRMGRADKALVRFGGGTLLSHAAARLGPQVERLALSANGDPGRFPGFAGPVLADAGNERLGPMAGVLAGLDWLAAEGGTHLATVAVDTPFFPMNMVTCLVYAGAATGGFAVAESGGRRHPTCALWPLTLRPGLATALAEGERRIGRWAEAEGAALAAFDEKPVDPFLNVNTAEDLARAAALLAAAAPRATPG